MPISLILGGGIITPAVSVRYLHRKNLSASDNLGADSYKTTASEDLDRFIKSEMKRHISSKGTSSAHCPWLNTQVSPIYQTFSLIAAPEQIQIQYITK